MFSSRNRAQTSLVYSGTQVNPRHNVHFRSSCSGIPLSYSHLHCNPERRNTRLRSNGRSARYNPWHTWTQRSHRLHNLRGTCKFESFPRTHRCCCSCWGRCRPWRSTQDQSIQMDRSSHHPCTFHRCQSTTRCTPSPHKLGPRSRFGKGMLTARHYHHTHRRFRSQGRLAESNPRLRNPCRTRTCRQHRCSDHGGSSCWGTYGPRKLCP